MVVVPLGDLAVLAELGGDLDRAMANRIRRLTEALRQNLLPGVQDIVPAFTTITVHYLPGVIGGERPDQRVSEWLHATAAQMVEQTIPPAREREVPVCYGGDYGPDLAGIARRLELPESEVIARHAQVLYEVRAIGFSPGFPYLTGLPAELATPRRSTPRTKVAAGSVGIGGSFTGVYPRAIPGGWNLIGRTPLSLFRTDAAVPAWLQVGDLVRFHPIDEEAFRAWKIDL